MTETKKINFSVDVAISGNSATYSYKDAAGNPSDGSPTVTTNNTQIIYTLNTDGLIFLPPTITGDTGGDLVPTISTDKQTLTIMDTDVTNESACLILVVAETSNPNIPFPSPDPQIVNRPPQ